MFKRHTPEKVQDWKEKILQQQNSGLSVTRWCQEHQVVECQFYYWRSKLFPKKVDVSGFTELVDAKNTGITIEYNGMRIHMDPNFDADTLKKCLSVIKVIKC
jgi:hypothetical protein